MNKALPVITESPQDLQWRMRAEPEVRQRHRSQALYLLASGQATSRVALAVHRHTIRAWLTQYEAGGLPALLTIKKAPGKRSTLTPSVLAHLRHRLAQPRGFASYGEIQRYLAHAARVGHRCAEPLRAGGGPFFFKQWGGPTPKAKGRVLVVTETPRPAPTSGRAYCESLYYWLYEKIRCHFL